MRQTSSIDPREDLPHDGPRGYRGETAGPQLERTSSPGATTAELERSEPCRG